MTATDRLLSNNAAYAVGFAKGALPAHPATKVAVVACMDARLDVHRILGLAEGDAHVIRNAGGVVTDDVMRSLLVSHRLLDTKEVLLIHHTDCGMLTFRDEEMKRRIEAEVGQPLPFELRAMSDLEASVLESIATIRDSPFLSYDSVRGFVYEVDSGRLREVR